MLTIEITPPPGITRLVERLSMLPRGLEKAARNAISRTIRGGRKDAGSKVKERYTIGSSAVTSTIKTRIKGLSGVMSSSGRRNPLDKFKHNPRQRINPEPAGGVYASVIRGQGGNIRRGFIQRTGGIWERTGAARFPIRKFKSVSAPQMLGSPPVSQFIIHKMEERFFKNFEHAAAAVIGVYL